MRAAAVRGVAVFRSEAARWIWGRAGRRRVSEQKEPREEVDAKQARRSDGCLRVCRRRLCCVSPTLY
jgi:hypothetical protein